MNMEDTIILLGDSPFIKGIEGQLSYILDKYKSMGINRIVDTYVTSYQVFTDERMISTGNKHRNIPAISLKRYGDMVQSSEKELYDSYVFNFNINNEKELLKDGRLAWCGFTHDYALSYLITKGWKNIVLIGAADFSMGLEHYSVPMAFTPSWNLVQKSKKFIEEICIKRANIYTCNPNSLLTVDRVSIEELLS